jgi:hypothetical protein
MFGGILNLSLFLNRISVRKETLMLIGLRQMKNTRVICTQVVPGCSSTRAVPGC